MATSGNHPSARKLLEQAALWHATLGDEQVTAEQCQACERWRNQSAEHEQAFRRMGDAWQQLDRIEPELRQPATKALLRALNKPKRLHTVLPAVSAIAIATLWVTLQSWSLTGLLSDYYAHKGSQQQIRLSDGSQLILNTDSAVDIDFTEHERRIRLNQGELYVQVAPNARRPFVIETPIGTATALGTRYAVRSDDDSMQVVVTESKVQVCPEAQQNCVVSHENQAVDVSGGNASQPATVDAQALTAWTKGRLVVDDWPLPQLLQEIARYYPGTLLFDESQLQSYRVSGVFMIDDPAQILTHLEKNLPIQIYRYGDLFALVSPRG